MKNVKTAFALEAIELGVDKIRPVRVVRPEVKASDTFARIVSSIRELGLIEPLVVFPQKGEPGAFTLLDGHVRLEAIRELGQTTVTCIVALDDEAVSFNTQVSHLAPIQANRMILKAIDAGIAPERIATVLNVSAKRIRDSRTRLQDIDPQAIELLKDKPIAEGALRQLKRVKPYRQIEIAQLMCLANSFTTPYARAMVGATHAEQMVDSGTPEAKSEQVAKVEAEIRAIEREFVVLEDTYSENTLNLQLARSYLSALLANTRVAKYLSNKHADLLAELRRVVDVSSLDA